MTYGNEQQEASGVSPNHIEMEITSVSRLEGRGNAGCYMVCFDEYTLQVHEDILIKYRMLKGSVFTQAELEEIVQADERQRAYAAGIALLSRKPRTRYELSMKLKEKGYTEIQIEQTISRLEDERLIDDAAYAREWADHRVRHQGKGKMWIRQELRQKGVAKPYIEAALGTVTEETEMDSARKLAEKRWRPAAGDQVREQKRKVVAFLMRRGYSGAVASRIVRELADSSSMESEEEFFGDIW